MDLREKIAELHRAYSYDDGGFCADAILALPSGLVAVKECQICRTFGDYPKECTHCHGSGRIVRQLSIKEAVSIAVSAVKRYHAGAHQKEQFILPSGERVEVEGGEDGYSKV